MKSIILISMTIMLIVCSGCSNNNPSDPNNDNFILQTKGYPFSEDSLYIEFVGGGFDKDIVQLYNNEKIVFSDTLTSDIHTSYAKGVAIKREDENRMRVIINLEHEQVFFLDTTLNFILIWLDRNKKPQFEINNEPTILE